VHQDGRAFGSASFPNTSWGLVLATRADDGGHAALGALCRRYWMPIYASLRRHGFPPADAEDLTQGFFLHLIERGSIARADPQRGRFRSFLLGALRWFLANDREREQALKRGGKSVFVPIDVSEIEAGMRFDADDAVSLDLQFDRQWALAVVRNALDALGAEYARQGQDREYGALRPCLDPFAASPSYAALAKHLDRNEGAVKVAVHRLRKRFREVLHGEIGCTVADARDIENELAYLRDVLASDPSAELA
jgi:RNA polymerase sigma-70 factor (ECF subfamily)